VKENKSFLDNPKVVTFFLIALPPVAWYAMWKNPYKYNSWFPKILLFYTVPTILIFFIQLLIISPKVPFPDTLPIYVGIVFYIFQIVFSLILRKEIKNDSPEIHTLIPITIGVLSIDTLLPLLIYYLILSPFRVFAFP
jgi:hypothetical protein